MGKACLFGESMKEVGNTCVSRNRSRFVSLTVFLVINQVLQIWTLLYSIFKYFCSRYLLLIEEYQEATSLSNSGNGL